MIKKCIVLQPVTTHFLITLTLSFLQPSSWWVGGLVAQPRCPVLLDEFGVVRDTHDEINHADVAERVFLV